MISVYSKNSAGSKPVTKVGGVGSLAIWLNGRHPNQFLYTDERGDRIPLDDIEDAMGYSAGSVRWERKKRDGRAIAESVVRSLNKLTR